MKQDLYNGMKTNKTKCRCECKELIDKGICDKIFIWNLSNCECECDKTCDIAEYLDYKNCKCRKTLVDKLIDECTETIEEVKLAKITLAENENNYRYISCTVYIYCIDDSNFYNFYRNYCIFCLLQLLFN